MLTLVSKDSVKNSDHFDVLCVLIACMVLEIINQNQMSKNQKSSLIVWNTVLDLFSQSDMKRYSTLWCQLSSSPTIDRLWYSNSRHDQGRWGSKLF